jgi:hypothetical protein
MENLIHDDGEDPCPHCGVEPEIRTCEYCGCQARIIDCGHMDQPRPISSWSGRNYCDDCFVYLYECGAII